MRQYITYQCETCKQKSSDRGEILKCEASHIGNGLTADEMQRWKALKEIARRYGYIISKTKNAQTEASFDKAIDDLATFEKEHGIVSN